MTDETNAPPVATHRDGALSAKIWRNHSKDGQPFYAVTFQRTFSDPETNEPRESRSFHGTDLLKLQRLAGESYRTVGRLRAQDREAQTQDSQPAREDRRESFRNERKSAPQRSRARDRQR